MAKLNFLKLLLKMVISLLPVVKETILSKHNEDETNLDEIIDSIITMLNTFYTLL